MTPRTPPAPSTAPPSPTPNSDHPFPLCRGDRPWPAGEHPRQRSAARAGPHPAATLLLPSTDFAVIGVAHRPTTLLPTRAPEPSRPGPAAHPAPATSHDVGKTRQTRPDRHRTTRARRLKIKLRATHRSRSPISRPRPVHRALGQHPVGTGGTSSASGRRVPCRRSARTLGPGRWSASPCPQIGCAQARTVSVLIGDSSEWPACGCARPASSQASAGWARRGRPTVSTPPICITHLHRSARLPAVARRICSYRKPGAICEVLDSADSAAGGPPLNWSKHAQPGTRPWASSTPNAPSRWPHPGCEPPRARPSPRWTGNGTGWSPTATIR